MNRKIHIENLRIRMPRSAKADAHDFAAGLGREIASRIAASTEGKSGQLRIDEISARKISIGREADLAERQAGIAASVADKVTKSFDGGVE